VEPASHRVPSDAGLGAAGGRGLALFRREGDRFPPEPGEASVHPARSAGARALRVSLTPFLAESSVFVGH
jgi:hypothetical protein